MGEGRDDADPSRHAWSVLILAVLLQNPRSRRDVWRDVTPNLQAPPLPTLCIVCNDSLRRVAEWWWCALYQCSKRGEIGGGGEGQSGRGKPTIFQVICLPRLYLGQASSSQQICETGGRVLLTLLDLNSFVRLDMLV